MKKCCKCKVIRNIQEFYKSKSNKDGLNYRCKECEKEYRDKNREVIREYHRKYYRENKIEMLKRDRLRHLRSGEKLKEYQSDYYQKNKDKLKERSKVYRFENKEKIKEYYVENYTKNKGLYIHHSTLRKKRIKRATPLWANLGRIREIYEMSQLMNEFMPKHNFHVDHVIPLKGKLVSGFHVENNLRILAGAINLSKSNKFNLKRRRP